MTVTSGLLGVDIDATPSANDTGHVLGTRVEGTGGAEYVYVVAGSAITQYAVVGVDEDWNAYPLTKAMADDGWVIGAAQVAFASGDYGWVATRGAGLTIQVKGSCAADVALYTSATAGKLDDTTTSQTKIAGVVLVTANATATASTSEALAVVPMRSAGF